VKYSIYTGTRWCKTTHTPNSYGLLQKTYPIMHPTTLSQSDLRHLRKKLVQEFNLTYTRASRLEEWQNLLRVLEVEDIPNSITQCKKKIKGIHVNLVDLTQGELRIFSSRADLQRYTIATNKWFPKQEAKKKGCEVLKGLLRVLTY